MGNAAGTQVFSFKEVTSTCVFCEHQGHSGKCGLSSLKLGFRNVSTLVELPRELEAVVVLTVSSGWVPIFSTSAICRYLAFLWKTISQCKHSSDRTSCHLHGVFQKDRIRCAEPSLRLTCYYKPSQFPHLLLHCALGNLTPSLIPQGKAVRLGQELGILTAMLN